MSNYVAGLAACYCLFSACLSAATWKGKVVDPSGAPIAGAQVSVVSRVGVEAQTTTGAEGAFVLNSADRANAHVVVTAPGFSTRTVASGGPEVIQLEIAPRVDSVRVAGSALDVPPAEQGGSTSLVPEEDVRRSNQSFALDLLRYVPGMTFNQTGAAGGVTSLFLRGGYSNFSLVQVDGVAVNSFGGAFDFAHIPTEAIDHVEVVRGPQSAIYGEYANSGVVNFVTRQPESTPHFDFLAEGGSYYERRFGATGAGSIAGFGLALSLSRYDDNGLVTNNEYRNEAECDATVRPAACEFARGFRFQQSGRAGRLGVQPEAYVYGDRQGEPGRE
jgi:outer membrane cobalamin receptor